MSFCLLPVVLPPGDQRHQAVLGEQVVLFQTTRLLEFQECLVPVPMVEMYLGGLDEKSGESRHCDAFGQTTGKSDGLQCLLVAAQVVQRAHPVAKEGQAQIKQP